MKKVALVTGSRRGIGQASAVALARQGMDVVICDVADEAAATLEAIEKTGQRCLYQRCDVGDRAQVEALFAAAVERFGRIDAVVNNAAINIRKALVDLEVEDVERVWAVSLWGVFHASQLGARQMVKQGEGGSIVMISSVHADRAYARSTAYNGAKAAVNQMAKTWAVELAPSRIRVNVIEPGWTDTPGERTFYTEEQIVEEGRKLPLGRLGRPEEIADAVAFLVSEKASYITGSILRVDGGIVLPR
ncbi:MAG: SDR family NAD(P)-dependent oxidoreductase [Bryobacteraceae bacterium]